MKNYLIWTLPILVIVLLGMYGCDNTRHSIGISGKPLSTDFEQGVKMNYKIVFGKVRNKNEEDED
ncbi:hypothetical protein [uncultured phage_Deep1-GF2-KM23-C739]|uniref:Lipoprotein n=1 Tax=uncultured phage_Deep1-GF2-KM23-C739 TaxID=2740798 RepID=A0A1B1IW06_9CAUD|nr:hypothetical protein HOU05_gp35 [uncultured phage_Deep1-GF2-KM23-C739]ANS05505.1 hypothetical protein [uncultured phage_Deep1-GF2-KM23-C739]